MIKIRFQLGDFERIPKALEDFYFDIDDFRPFYKNHFIPRYLADVNANFESEGGAVGGWHELSPEYEAWKRARYGNKKINQLTGALKRSFSPKGRSKLLSLRMERKQLHIGSVVDYAFYVNRERRFMLGFQDINQKEYMLMLGRWVIELAKKAGLVKSGSGGR
jgi:hypothetical protein